MGQSRASKSKQAGGDHRALGGQSDCPEQDAPSHQVESSGSCPETAGDMLTELYRHHSRQGI